MTTDARKFLIDAGLRVAGQRGRLSEQCKHTIEVAIAAGLTFSNWDAENRTIVKETKPATRRKKKDKSLITADEPKDYGIVRGANALRVTSKDGTTQIIDVHHVCRRPIERCTCKPLHVQPWMQAEKIEFITINK